MTSWRWLFRGAERDRAYQRLQSLREAYAEQGNRVIKLSARTDLLRKSAGATKRSFEFVEKAFVEATMEYSRAQVLIDNLAAGLEQGRVGDFAAAEGVVKGIGPKLDELDRHLTKWESRWTQVPHEIDAAQRSLQGLREQFGEAERSLGAALPLERNFAALEKHLENARTTLAGGNPIEAGHLVDDFQIALGKVATEVGLFSSGLAAIQQVEQGLARIRSVVDPAAPALSQAEGILPRLRPALAAGNFGPFQQDLLEIQRLLSSVKPAGGQ